MQVSSVRTVQREVSLKALSVPSQDVDGIVIVPPKSRPRHEWRIGAKGEIAMACYVGITTNLVRRKREHLANHPRLKNWRRVGGTYRSKTAAQRAEDALARRLGCRAHHGGGPERANWYVYTFNY